MQCPPLPKVLRLKSAVYYMLVVLALASCGSPKRMLQLKVYPEDSFVVYETTNTELTLTQNSGDPKTLRSGREIVYRLDVASVDDSGNVDFDVTIQKAKYRLFLVPLGKALTGKSFSMRMAPDGRITAFQGTDALRRHVADEIVIESSGGGPRRAEATKKRMLVQIEDDVLQGKFEIIFRVRPATPVAQGDQWSREDIPLPHNAVIDSAQLTLTSWEDDEVVISIDSTVRSVGTDPSRDLSGKTTCTVILDAVSGLPKSLSFDRYLEGTTKTPGADPTPLTVKEEAFVELLRL